MPDFLLELRCEEIPARMQAGARAELEKLFRRELAAAGVDVGDVTVWSTPRRLALIATGLPDATEAVSEEAKGPPKGAPDAALEGFCRKNGVTKDRLQLRDVKGRPTWFAVIEKPGRATRDVLALAIPVIVRDFTWPKSMRWGAPSISTESTRWVRPLTGLIALLGDEVVETSLSWVHVYERRDGSLLKRIDDPGITSGRTTLGHRFHHRGAITIGGVHDYQEKLRACHVIVDHEERAALIREGAAQAAAEAGLTLVEDEGLVIENAGLTEWPVPLLGRFDEAFLDVPPEVIQLTARVNQKYFVLQESPPLGEVAARSADGGGAARAVQAPSDPSAGADGPPPPEGESLKLANAFVCTANIAAEDGGAAIVEGNRKVLAARLSDARFFWEQDRKTTLAEHARKLERITFHEKLGTVADKVERVAKLARWLVESDIVTADLIRGPASSSAALEEKRDPGSEAGVTMDELAQLAEDAAKLAKADLVTEMVGEFPELQGVMGGYYARAEGLDPRIADAIRDHYKPVGQGDEVPTAPVTVAVSLADKLDTLIQFFRVGEKPTGSKDPFALRRAMLGVLATVQINGLRLPLHELLEREFLGHIESGAGTSFMDFAIERLKIQQRDAGIRHDLIDAVFFRSVEDDLVRLLARVKALQHYIETAEGADLLAAYKRAANILRKENWSPAEAGASGGEAPAEGGPRLRGDSAPLNTQGIARTGEEDPLALVDDPMMAEVVKAQLEEKQNKSLSYTPPDEETALIFALDSAEPAAVRAVEAEDFAGAMTALATLRGPIDAFFDSVTVNDADPAKRTARLGLLARFRDAVHRVADFGRIEG